MTCEHLLETGRTIETHLAIEDTLAGPATPIPPTVAGLVQVICALDPPVLGCTSPSPIAHVERYNRLARVRMGEALRWRRAVASVGSIADLWISNIPASEGTSSRPHLRNLKTFAANLLQRFTDGSHGADPLPYTHPTFHRAYLAAADALIDILTDREHIARVQAFQDDATISDGAKADWIALYGLTVYKAVCALSDSRRSRIVGEMLRATFEPHGFVAGRGESPRPPSLLSNLVSVLQLGDNVAGSGGLIVGFLHLACIWQLRVSGGDRAHAGSVVRAIRTTIGALALHDEALSRYEAALVAGDREAASEALGSITPGPVFASLNAFVNIYQAFEAFDALGRDPSLETCVSFISSTFSAGHATLEALHAISSALLPARIIGPELRGLTYARAFVGALHTAVEVTDDCVGMLGAISTIIGGTVGMIEGAERGDWIQVTSNGFQVASGVLTGIAIVTGAEGLEPVAITAQIAAWIVERAGDTPTRRAQDICWSLAHSLGEGTNAAVSRAIGFGDVSGFESVARNAEFFELDAANFGIGASTLAERNARYEVSRVVFARLQAIGIADDQARGLMVHYGDPTPAHAHDAMG